MMKHSRPVSILMADDDELDRRMVQKALAKSRLANELVCVKDGEELMDYLLHRGEYADAQRFPRPGVLLLDLNMPRKNGQEALEEIRANPGLCSLPVVVLTTSEDEIDILRSYQLGANSYITKPVTFEALVEVIRSLGNYWFTIVELPGEC
jgi:CheY-like chemotaxis protein